MKMISAGFVVLLVMLYVIVGAFLDAYYGRD